MEMAVIENVESLCLFMQNFDLFEKKKKEMAVIEHV